MQNITHYKLWNEGFCCCMCIKSLSLLFTKRSNTWASFITCLHCGYLTSCLDDLHVFWRWERERDIRVAKWASLLVIVQVISFAVNHTEGNFSTLRTAMPVKIQIAFTLSKMSTEEVETITGRSALYRRLSPSSAQSKFSFLYNKLQPLGPRVSTQI